MEHELKTWPAYYDGIASGVKTFELRKDDRPYAVGDVLLLREWDPDEFEAQWAYEERALPGDPMSRADAWIAAKQRATDAAYTGRACRRRVTYVARGGLIPAGYVVMSIVEEPTP